jgi:NAD(P)-dependent dehydrogenase (short-subunit alcohol dehydrogenase family)
MERLRGRVALVTGASRGGGKGIALVLGEEGATVYVTGQHGIAGPGPTVPLSSAHRAHRAHRARRARRGRHVRMSLCLPGRQVRIASPALAD